MNMTNIKVKASDFWFSKYSKEIIIKTELMCRLRPPHVATEKCLVFCVGISFTGDFKNSCYTNIHPE